MRDPGALIQGVVARHGADPSKLLQILIEAQDAIGHLPAAVLTDIARGLGLPRARVEGVAGFYRFLHPAPAGRYRILFSDNITDRFAGAPALMEALCRQLWVEPGRVAPDGLVSVDTTSCTGMGDQGPALLVNGLPVTRLDPVRVAQIGELVQREVALAEWPSEFFRVEDNVRRSDALLDCTAPDGAALRSALRHGRAGWLGEIARARLRGRGGAGFATAAKWSACRDARGDDKVVVCNADEGEPGTFKDRVLLASRADLVFDGMTLAAWAVGANLGLLYLRGEYRFLLAPLRAALERRRGAGLLGSDILGERGFDFDIEIHLGAGAYVCGEESALLESLEGRRGTPRIRPPFPTAHGYLGRPTVVNNVETLATAAWIGLEGADAFAARGTAQSAGTKLLSVSGDCAAPGVYEYPFGVAVERVLEDCGARDVHAVQVGGASGVTLAGHELSRRIAFEDVATAGSFMTFDSRRDAFEIARNFVHFFAHESCGFCTPCRVGTSLLKGYMDKLASGAGAKVDLAEIESVGRLLKHTSHCGLGVTAPNAVLDTLQKFRPSYERRLQSLEFRPAFDLDAALAPARRMTGRDDRAAHFDDEEAAR